MKNGFVLIITVAFLAILAANAFIFTEFVRLRSEVQYNQNFRFLADRVARTGISAGEIVLSLDKNSYDWFDDVWVKPKSLVFPEGSVEVTIEPLDARFNINSILNNDKSINTQSVNLFSNLLSVMGFPSSLLDTLLDWLDSDDFPRIFGAESEYYGTFNPPYKPANGPLGDVTELVFIKGFTPEILMSGEDRTGLSDLLTIFSDNKINVNIASPLILQMLGYSTDSVEKILNERELRPLSMNILMNIDRQTTSSLTRVIKFSSSFFCIRAVADCNGVMSTQFLIVQRTSSGIKRLKWERN
ncbi:MAG TPA: type II secretion system protein GspK [Candidatus Ratteibacteria bacterium]|uniref:Type II secretion system protein K n=1 Tax=candidate division TA06 bacterium ADurb.Bin131 TaxID=1852827 RepID=A0A1V6C5J8_UNCT6|nr:MAG: putative type II secretion system protein K [candidate division TA06 bacterium ADurb.Bin131]HOC02244.1 type II secretion system protein GspK [bacterium]HRS06673.1 type II secretion system protein GspK [Candidatus Ratteibacteria bacterium]HON05182.1 type II secretion system protein GspK [bacterium]HPC29912.1 type II secretion system protein GspK [bacterium]